MSNSIISLCFGILSVVCNIVSVQMKTKRNIMIFLMLSSIFAGLNFLYLGSYSGCYVCLFAVIEILINYYFEKNKKKIPLYIILFYIIISIILGIISYRELLDIVPIICSLMFCLVVCSRKESNIRKLILLNQSVWLGYDIIIGSALVISNILSIISVSISIYRFDIKKTKKKIKR